MKEMLVMLFLLFVDQTVPINGAGGEPASPRSTAPILGVKAANKVSDQEISSDSTSDNNRRSPNANGSIITAKTRASDASDNRSVDTDATGSTVSSSFAAGSGANSGKRNGKANKRASGNGPALDAVPEQASSEDSISVNINTKQYQSGLSKIGLEHLLQFCALWGCLWDELPPDSDVNTPENNSSNVSLSGKDTWKRLTSGRLDAIVEKSRKLGSSYVALVEEVGKQMKTMGIGVNGHSSIRSVNGFSSTLFPMSMKSFVNIALTVSQMTPSPDTNTNDNVESILSLSQLRKALRIFSVTPTVAQVCLLINFAYANCSFDAMSLVYRNARLSRFH
jgi:hypothetical protein